MVKLTDKQKEEIIKSFEKGKKVGEIAKLLSLSYDKVYSFCQTLKIEPKKEEIKQYYTKEEVGEIPIIKMFGWKLTDEQIKEVIETGKLMTGDFNMLRNKK